MSGVGEKIFIMLFLPSVFFLGGARMMSMMSDREYVTDRLREQISKAEDRKPLNLRWGYDTAALKSLWGVLDKRGLEAERKFLTLDLIFPFVYGGAWAISLLIGWVALGRPFNPCWAIAPVSITMVADWTENLVQLNQLQRYLTSGVESLESGWVQVASAATITKMCFVIVTSVFIIILSVVLIFRHPIDPA